MKRRNIILFNVITFILGWLIPICGEGIPTIKDAFYIVYETNGPAITLNTVTTPKRNSLLQNYPNSFNPECYMPYEIRHQTLDYRHQTVKIRIYNILGQEVREIDLGEKPAGSYVTKDKAAYWDGTG